MHANSPGRASQHSRLAEPAAAGAPASDLHRQPIVHCLDVRHQPNLPQDQSLSVGAFVSQSLGHPFSGSSSCQPVSPSVICPAGLSLSRSVCRSVNWRKDSAAHALLRQAAAQPAHWEAAPAGRGLVRRRAASRVRGRPRDSGRRRRRTCERREPIFQKRRTSFGGSCTIFRASS
jgi:hypothetical protein